MENSEKITNLCLYSKPSELNTGWTSGVGTDNGRFYSYDRPSPEPVGLALVGTTTAPGAYIPVEGDEIYTCSVGVENIGSTTIPRIAPRWWGEGGDPTYVNGLPPFEDLLPGQRRIYTETILTHSETTTLRVSIGQGPGPTNPFTLLLLDGISFFKGDCTVGLLHGDMTPFEYRGRWAIPEWDDPPYPSTSSLSFRDKVPGRHFFEIGVDRGMLAVDNDRAVQWKGLTSVESNANNGGLTSYYIDGLKRLMVQGAEELELSIAAFSAPSEFSSCEGLGTLVSGLYIGNQPRTPFNFSYRSLVGDERKGITLGYKIHIIYNAMVDNTGQGYQTIDGSMNPSQKSWAIKTKPMSVVHNGVRFVGSEIILDSTETDPAFLKAVEDVLYGVDGMEPRIPLPGEIIALASP